MFISCPGDGIRVACAELLVHAVTLLEPQERELIKNHLSEKTVHLKFLKYKQAFLLYLSKITNFYSILERNYFSHHRFP